ncbi:MAG TPA: UDP-N-acetylglucosamine--N-acetylmuramyl-(pentapeptide) pyrophosphoryl-undecaprenol N-acetylglucosamine transferase [Geminicoccaceae bacterium]
MASAAPLLSEGTPRVLFACGGTGGHVYPAIAIADAVRAARPGAAVAFAGTRDRMEWTAVPKAGYPIHAVTVSGFQRGLSGAALKRNATFPLKLAKGLWESWRLVGAFDADVVVGTGGYVSGPVGLAAALRGRPLVVQEQNAIAGATNKMLARRAARVFVGFDATRGDLPTGEAAGNPVRADLVAASATPEARLAARAELGIAADADVLLVTGGSLGAGPLNVALERHLGTVFGNPRAVVLWAAGTRYYDAVRAAAPVHDRLHLVPYLDRMDLAYAAADLAIARSGALTCSELAATGTPSVLVPSPNVTADHQTKNAAALAGAGAAVLLPEPRLAGEFATVVLPLLHDAGRRAAMRAAAASVARPDAARTIAQAVVALAERRPQPAAPR